MEATALATAFEIGRASLEQARRITLGLAEDIPDDQRCHRPCSGGNHACWILGHIACADDLFMTSVGQQPVVNVPQ